MKLWLMWKAHGDAGLEARIDRLYGLAAIATEHVKASAAAGGGLRIAVSGGCTNVCFFVVPRALRHLDTSSPAALAASAKTTDDVARLNRVAPFVKDQMQRSGDQMVGFQAVDGLPNFFRLVFVSTSETLQEREVTGALDRMVEISEQMDLD